MAHSGLCASRDENILPVVKAVSASLWRYLCDRPTGSFFHLRVALDDGTNMSCWLLLCHNRLAGPRLNLVCPCTFSESERFLRPNVLPGFGGVSHDYMQLISYVGCLWKSLPPSGPDNPYVTDIFAAPVPRDRGLLIPAANSALVDPDWRLILPAGETRIFPPIVHCRAREPVSNVVRGLRGLRPKRRTPTSRGGLRFTMPKTRIRDDDDFSEASDEGYGSSVRSSEGQTDSSDAEEDDSGDEEEERARPGDNAIPFGPWTISFVRERGEIVGWGGNCGQHFGGTTQCRKSLRFCGQSSDHTRCLIKQWLRMGATIPCTRPNGRREHIFMCSRDDIPVRPEHELDAEASTCL